MSVRVSPVPTIDDEEPPKELEYRDWTPEQTRVICYTNQPSRYKFDLSASDAESARSHCEANFGKVLEFNEVPGRFFCRVMRRRA